MLESILIKSIKESQIIGRMRGREIAEDRTKHVVCGEEAEIEEYLCAISISSAARTQDQLDEATKLYLK